MSVSEFSRITTHVHHLVAELVDLGEGVMLRLNQRETRESPRGTQRLTMVQFGDYAEAVWRFANGGAENYYAQKYSVEFVGRLAARKDMDCLTVINVSANATDEVLPNGVRAFGIELYPRGRRPRYRELVDAVKRTLPTHLLVAAPIRQLIRWGIRARIPVLPMFADSFYATGFRAAIECWLLAFSLNDPSIEIVANHNLAASVDLKRIGVDPKKIVPYDWPAVIDPRSYAPKSAPPGNRAFRLIYVGSVIEAKGVGDAIQAVSRLRKRGKDVELTIIGQGDTDRFKQLAKVEDVESYVFFLGRKSHPEVLAAMRDHDAVLVPSHWGYPEGLPMTLYEAMCTRTPLLTSDHPMFKLRIRDRQNALIFPARNPSAFAERIDELASTPELYGKLSAMAEKTADSYLCPMKFDQLVLDFLSPTKRRKLRDYSLANYAYFDDADI